MFSSFDCVFSLDSALRYRATTDLKYIEDYIGGFHPLFIPLTRFFYIPLSHIMHPLYIVWVLMALCASLSNVMFYLVLEQLQLHKRIILPMTILFASSFSTILYGTFYDGPLFVGLFTNIFLYTVIKHRDIFKNPIHFIILAFLSLGGLINGILHFLTFSAAMMIKRPFVISSAYYIRNILCFCAAYSAFIYFMMASGWFSIHYITNVQNALKQHEYYLNAYLVAIDNVAVINGKLNHILWAFSNLFSTQAYQNLFSGLLTNPIIAYPFLYGKDAFWAHRCVWFDFSALHHSTCIGVCIFALYLCGAYQCLKSKTRILIALLLCSITYIGFFGFAFTTLTSYLYGGQFLPFYLSIAAIGASKLYVINDQKTHAKYRFVKPTLYYALLLLIFVVFISNLMQWPELNHYMLKKYAR